MSIYDVVSEMSAKQLRKTETGDERIIGSILGLVAENYSKDRPGMIQVEIPIRDEESSILRWAKVAHMYSGKEWGEYFHPEIGDQVLLAFEHGSLERPFVIGSVPRDNDKFISQTAQKENPVKRIVTRHGNELSFEDAKEGEGDRDRILVQTSGGGQSISLENDKKQIVIKAEEKIVIKVGDSVTVTLNGTNGSVSIDAQKVSIKASGRLQLESDGPAKLSGQQTIIEASSVLKENSSGMVSIQGSPIKLG